MVWHHVTLKYFHSFVPAQCFYYLFQTFSILIIDDFSSILRCEHNMIFTGPFRMGQPIYFCMH